MTFKELPIGARFRRASGRKEVEWVKIEPIRYPSGSVKFNVRRVDSEQGGNFGQNAKVLVPPYGDTTGAKRQQQRYANLKEMIIAAGWKSRAELETAFIKGVVAIPRKQMSATEFDTAVNQMAAED